MRWMKVHEKNKDLFVELCILLHSVTNQPCNVQAIITHDQLHIDYLSCFQAAENKVITVQTRV